MIKRIAVDVMGGDNPPSEIISGCALALSKDPSISLNLIGDMNILEDEVKKQNIDMSKVKLISSKDDIEMSEPPVEAIRKKKTSSIVLGLKSLKDKEVDGFISAGNTGAVLAGGQLIVGRIKGVNRAPLAILLPTLKKEVLLLDCGANVDAKDINLLEFAKLGKVYIEKRLNRNNPKIALLNIGVEKEKGNALLKSAYELFEKEKMLNFVGNIEARDIVSGDVDIVVCDAFDGNIVLKTMEGVIKALLTKMKKAFYKNFFSKIAALILKKNLKNELSDFDINRYGGAPMLGLRGLVLKSHGNSDKIAISNTILQCSQLIDVNIIEAFEKAIGGELV